MWFLAKHIDMYNSGELCRTAQSPEAQYLQYYCLIMCTLIERTEHSQIGPSKYHRGPTQVIAKVNITD